MRALFVQGQEGKSKVDWERSLSSARLIASNCLADWSGHWSRAQQSLWWETESAQRGQSSWSFQGQTSEKAEVSRVSAPDTFRWGSQHLHLTTHDNIPQARTAATQVEAGGGGIQFPSQAKS